MKLDLVAVAVKYLEGDDRVSGEEVRGPKSSML